MIGIFKAQAQAITLNTYLPMIFNPPTAAPSPTQTPTPTSSPTPTETPTPIPSATPTSSPTATSTATATSTPTQPPATTGDIKIINILFDGSGSSEPDEYVEIRNNSGYAIQIQNWTLRDIANHVYTFPAYLIQPGQVCRIYTNQNHPETCGFNYGNSSAIWNNGGDTATLRDALGNLVHTYTY